MRSAARAAATAAVAISGLCQGSFAYGAGAASRIVDRTLVCQMPGEGFPDSTRFLSFAASARSDPYGYLSLTNGPSHQVRVHLQIGPGGRDRTGSLAFDRTECAASRFRITISSRGLTSVTSARSLRSSVDCDVSPSVAVRVRARFKRPTGFTRDPLIPALARARGVIEAASLAIVTMPGRKPLVFASVGERGSSARLYVDDSRCRAER